MKFKIYNYILCLVASVGMMACEDVIDVTLGDSTPQLTVDAWISNQLATQTFRLSISQDYFNNNPTAGASGATVVVTDNLGNTYNFTESTTTPGSYTSNFQGAIDVTYTLNVQYQGQEYQASTTLSRVPPIDSLVFKTAEEADDGPGSVSEGFQAEFFAKDIPGVGDFYRIKTYQNGVLMNKPTDLTSFQDLNVDGLPFILPIRLSINPSNEDGSGFAQGDVVRVELLSISEEAFLFFDQLETQTNNGGLFANPIANVPTNIINVNPSGSKAVGFFYASAVSTIEGTVQ
ncbi:MAG TPA: DUF4249 domain-containing protein [Microscillaceae bacterium]|nr:DUF4249 domain-containing protein [Microscillaceae bacterium]